MTDHDTRKAISQKFCPRFGQTAVQLRFISGKQLQEAICIQVQEELTGAGHRLLGQILFELGWLSARQVEIVLNEVIKRMRAEAGQ
jgi:hypothetical protein